MGLLVQIKEEPVVISSHTSTILAGTAEVKKPLKKGPWTATKDAILTEYVEKHGEGYWNAVQKNTGLQRCTKSQGSVRSFNEGLSCEPMAEPMLSLLSEPSS
ncbi:hypothetical protein IEQ34_002292 [Dendrobium chrysotoxum]|uniref:Myb-like domain-containing protein n=1 Tax=Dendrobium chrysotoxum TaxID=161865 RepID=A0AAV7HLP0_DENCH|nr:hypothetical protein IEQ34_002292 [Dendrobium chrysotoxum]